MKTASFAIGSSVVILILVLSLLWHYSYMKPQWATEKQVDQIATTCLNERWEGEPTKNPYITKGDVDKDSWGRPIHVTRIDTETSLSWHVVSCGRDGVADTYDDINVMRTDYNKSKIIGKWVGKKSKQALEGVADGFNEKSEFPTTFEPAPPKKWHQRIMGREITVK